MTYKPRIIVDFDGTMVTNVWPDMGEWLPGAVTAMEAFNDAGLEVVLQSCRLSPLEHRSNEVRDPKEVAEETLRVRDKLDFGGLPFVKIWSGFGKPAGLFYIDDRGMHYPGNEDSWEKITQRVLLGTTRVRGIDEPVE